jgi:hypothetical protein
MARRRRARRHHLPSIRNAARHALWLTVATVFVVLDLGMVVFEVVPRIPVSFYDEPPALTRHLPADRTQWRLFHYAEMHKQRDVVKAYFADHPDRYWVSRNAMFDDARAVPDRMALDSDYDLTALTPRRISCSPPPISPTFAATGRRRRVDVERLVSRRVSRSPRSVRGSPRRPPHPPARRHPGPARYPRYSFAERLEPIADRKDFVRKVGSRRFPKGTAFVRAEAFPPAGGTVTASGRPQTPRTSKSRPEDARFSSSASRRINTGGSPSTAARQRRCRRTSATRA